MEVLFHHKGSVRNLRLAFCIYRSETGKVTFFRKARVSGHLCGALPLQSLLRSPQSLFYQYLLPAGGRRYIGLSIYRKSCSASSGSPALCSLHTPCRAFVSGPPVSVSL